MDNKLIGNEKNILFYNDEEGNTKVEVLLENEDVWLNAEALATLFNIDRSGIVRHISNIYKDDELNEISRNIDVAKVVYKPVEQNQFGLVPVEFIYTENNIDVKRFFCLWQ